MRLLSLTTLLLPVALGAQAHDHSAPSANPEEDAIHASMGHHMAESRHMRMTPSRTATHADSVRAAAIVDTLRRFMSKYADTTAAVADGYRMFAPNVKTQKVYHFSNTRRAVKSAFTFDASAPTSLLYTKDSTTGRFVLVGAMYTAPRRTSVEDLDRRVPTSLAPWHLHVNLCLPKRGHEERLRERDSKGRPLFGTEGVIETEQGCDMAGGRFFPTLFGWMVHVNASSADPWAESPGH